MFKKKYLGKSKLPQASVCVKCQIVMRGVQMYSTGCWPDTSHSRYLQLPQVCGLDYNSYWMLHDCTQKLNYYYYFTCWQIICCPTHLHITTTTTTNILITLKRNQQGRTLALCCGKYRCSFKCHIYIYKYIYNCQSLKSETKSGVSGSALFIPVVCFWVPSRLDLNDFDKGERFVWCRVWLQWFTGKGRRRRRRLFDLWK